jgi:septal ring factor EnvC (AmiA/AmiB activator)
MRRTLKRTKSKKQPGRVRDLKPAKEAKGSGKIEHAVERHETAVTEDAKELKKLRDEIEQIKSDIAHFTDDRANTESKGLREWLRLCRATGSRIHNRLSDLFSPR